ncbi:MAG: hypothetical protein WC816_11820 [Sphingomonas sp.]
MIGCTAPFNETGDEPGAAGSDVARATLTGLFVPTGNGAPYTTPDRTNIWCEFRLANDVMANGVAPGNTGAVTGRTDNVSSVGTCRDRTFAFATKARGGTGHSITARTVAQPVITASRKRSGLPARLIRPR